MERENYSNNRGGGRTGGGGRGGRWGGDQRPPLQAIGGGGGRGGPGYGGGGPQQTMGGGGGRSGSGYGGGGYQGGGGGRGGPGYGGGGTQGGGGGRGGPQGGGGGGYQGGGGGYQGGGGGRGCYGGGPQQNTGRGGGGRGGYCGGDGGGSNPYRSDPGSGRGGGGYGRGGGRGQQQQPQRPSQPMPDMQLLKISENLPIPSSPKDAKTDLFPVRRPDRGGTLTIRAPRLLVNHFPIKFNPNSTYIHYDIDIKLEIPPNGRPLKMNTSELRMIKDKVFSDNSSEFPLSSQTAYDGEKNIYSAVELPMGIFKVDFSIAEDMRSSSYVVTIKEVNRLKLSKLKNYLEGIVTTIPREVLQGMDLVMKENPSRCCISLGRSYFPFENNREDDLKWGITASKGFQHSLKSTSQGLAMCLDYTVLAFRKPLPVINYLLEYTMGNDRDLNALRKLDRERIMEALKGLKVYVTHRVTKQKFIVAGLTDKTTRNESFGIEGPDGVRQVGVVEYYREKYGKEIVHLDIPCLNLGKGNRKNYVPMEFCIVVEGQRFRKEDLGKDAERSLKNMSLVKPRVRRNIICEMVQAADGPSGGEVSKNFGLDVVKEMTKVEARVINPPQLKVGGDNIVNVDREKCQWNLVNKSVVEGKSLDRWAIIDFSSRLDAGNFIPSLRNRCQKLGMRVEEPLVYRKETMAPFSNMNRLNKILESVIGEAGGRLQMIVCVMAAVHPGYSNLKWLSETKIGVITQCCLVGPANDAKDQYLANLAIKINAKLGGSNMELTHAFPNFPGEGPAMFIGADVNHPSSQAGDGSRACKDAPPSIAAVVGTVNWPAANRYAARVAPQYGGTEKILNFGSMCKELIEAYAKVNKVKPQRIVVFRDGVSEGQFEMVLNKELFDLKTAIYEKDYRPTITVVVAQKRHQTRLFPFGREDEGETGNVSPGTVVDTVITHPFEFDFYLNSHYGGLGTSKPTHYYVLYDDHNFTSDLMEKLVYDLCFTFARCTKPVSLVPPVYYADLVAYRGRMFQDVVGMLPSPGVTPFKLHPELEDRMFFV